MACARGVALLAAWRGINLRTFFSAWPSRIRPITLHGSISRVRFLLRLLNNARLANASSARRAGSSTQQPPRRRNRRVIAIKKADQPNAAIGEINGVLASTPSIMYGAAEITRRQPRSVTCARPRRRPSLDSCQYRWRIKSWPPSSS